MNEELEKFLGPVSEKLQSTLGGWVQDQESNYTERLKKISSALEKAAQELKQCGEEGLGSMLERGTEGLNQIAERVEGSDPKELIAELRNLSRTNPAGVFMASLVAGFLGGRVGHAAMADKSVSASDQASLSGNSSFSSEGISAGTSSFDLGSSSDMSTGSSFGSSSNITSNNNGMGSSSRLGSSPSQNTSNSDSRDLAGNLGNDKSEDQRRTSGNSIGEESSSMSASGSSSDKGESGSEKNTTPDFQTIANRTRSTDRAKDSRTDSSNRL